MLLVISILVLVLMFMPRVATADVQMRMTAEKAQAVNALLAVCDKYKDLGNAATDVGDKGHNAWKKWELSQKNAEHGLVEIRNLLIGGGMVAGVEKIVEVMGKWAERTEELRKLNSELANETAQVQRALVNQANLQGITPTQAAEHAGRVVARTGATKEVASAAIAGAYGAGLPAGSEEVIASAVAQTGGGAADADAVTALARRGNLGTLDEVRGFVGKVMASRLTSEGLADTAGGIRKGQTADILKGADISSAAVRAAQAGAVTKSTREVRSFLDKVATGFDDPAMQAMIAAKVGKPFAGLSTNEQWAGLEQVITGTPEAELKARLPKYTALGDAERMFSAVGLKAGAAAKAKVDAATGATFAKSAEDFLGTAPAQQTMLVEGHQLEEAQRGSYVTQRGLIRTMGQTIAKNAKENIGNIEATAEWMSSFMNAPFTKSDTLATQAGGEAYQLEQLGVRPRGKVGGFTQQSLANELRDAKAARGIPEEGIIGAGGKVFMPDDTVRPLSDFKAPGPQSVNYHIHGDLYGFEMDPTRLPDNSPSRIGIG